MSKSLMLILTMAMLVWSLTACGCTAKQAGEQEQTSNNGQSDSAIVDDNNSGGSGGGAANSGESGSAANGSGAGNDQNGSAGNGVGDAITNGIDDMTGAVENAGDALTGNSATGGVSYEQMLRNARVHDRDGDLTDHENSVSRNMF